MAARRLIETIEADFILEIYQGVNYSLIMSYSDGNNTPVDLTGKIISIKIKDVFPNQLNLFSNTGTSILGSSITISDAVGGEFRVRLTEAETATAQLGTGGKYWIELYDGDDQNLLWLDCVCVKSL